MSHSKHPRRLLYILVGILFILSASITVFKLRYLDFSLSNRKSFFYQVDSSFTFTPEPEREIRLSLALPELSPGYGLSVSPNRSEGFRVERRGEERLVTLTLPAGSDRREVSLRFRVIPYPEAKENSAPPHETPLSILPDATRSAYGQLLAKVDSEKKLLPGNLIPALLRELSHLSPDAKRALSLPSGVEGSVDGAITLLGERGVPARILRGIYLDERRTMQQPTLFLDAFYDGAWHVFQPNTGAEGAPSDLLILQRGGKSLFEVSGARNSSVRFAVTRVPAGAEKLNELRSTLLGRAELPVFALFSLPAMEQNAFKHLALLPLAILLIVLIRNVIGIQTMGTFMPVLIAMAFLEMKLLPGIVNFTLILAAGLAIRSWLSHLNLLMVPRISAVVVVVILLMQLISVLGYAFNLHDFMGVTYFPLIIIAWTIERASTIWEEDGAINTLKQLTASLAAAMICYLILSSYYLQYVLYTFSELNLVILGVVLLLGTYTGYRLTELARFRPLVKK